MTAEQLTRTLDAYLGDARHAVVLENGAVLFNLATAKYSISGEGNKCVLHLWSEERNAVRRVLDAELQDGALRLSVLKFGQSRPSRLEVCRDADGRSPSARKSARITFQQKLKRILLRDNPGWKLERVTNSPDLERSFGPVYTRALLKRGTSAFAVLGVNAQEPQPAVDGALTFGILWMDYCREQHAQRCHVEGLKVFVAQGRSMIVRERIAHLNSAAAKWQLYSVDESTESTQPLDCGDHGNVETRLLHCPDHESVRRRFAVSVSRITALVPQAETAVVSATEISFRLHGLEFARARIGAAPGAFSFRNAETITFGTGANETELNEANERQFIDLMQRVHELRSPYAHANPLWRMVPERWLESIAVRDVSALDDRLDNRFVYSQVPAFAASDRGMIDVLTSTRERRLAILELKADEDIHLPLQGVDYWSRVVWHHKRGEFQRFGYFGGTTLSEEPPLLLLVAPALHVHPTTDTLIRYIAPEIPIELIAVDERWREGLKVVFRKRHSHSNN